MMGAIYVRTIDSTGADEYSVRVAAYNPRNDKYSIVIEINDEPLAFSVGEAESIARLILCAVSASRTAS